MEQTEVHQNENIIEQWNVKLKEFPQMVWSRGVVPITKEQIQRSKDTRNPYHMN